MPNTDVPAAATGLPETERANIALNLMHDHALNLGQFLRVLRCAADSAESIGLDNVQAISTLLADISDLLERAEDDTTQLTSAIERLPVYRQLLGDNFRSRFGISRDGDLVEYEPCGRIVGAVA